MGRTFLQGVTLDAWAYDCSKKNFGHPANGLDLLFAGRDTGDRIVQAGIQGLPHRGAQRIARGVAAQVVLDAAPAVRVLSGDAQCCDITLRDARHAGNVSLSVHGQLVKPQPMPGVAGVDVDGILSGDAQ